VVEVFNGGDDRTNARKLLVCVTLQSAIDSMLDSIRDVDNIDKTLLQWHMKIFEPEGINTVGIKSRMKDALTELDDAYNTVCMK